MRIYIYDDFDIWGGDHNIDLEEGVTILVGKNGAGKSTTLIYVKDYCDTHKIHHLDFDNLQDGGALHGDKLLNMSRDMIKTATYITSSEGQKIIQAFGDFVSKIGRGVRTACEDPDCHTLVITLDALDSGLSINNIRDIKNLFPLISEDCEKSGVKLYIVAAANSYEFAKGEDCIDVKTGDHIWFENYDNYANFICKED